MPQRRWTFLVWMAGDNDLEKYADRDLTEMKKVGSTDDVAVVAQVDRFKDRKTRRYLLTKGGKLDKDIVQDLGETNSGDPQVAADFIAWGIKKYPAARICAVLWNHGSGIDEEKARGLVGGRPRRSLFAASRRDELRPRGIGYDDTSDDFLDNLELAQVLEQVVVRTGRTIDLLGFDACLMSMLEIALQVQPHVRSLVSSQEVEPLDGWPYDTVLSDLVAQPGLTAADLGRTIVRRYVESYKSDIVTLSTLDLRAADVTTGAVDQLAKALLAATAQNSAERNAVRAASVAVQRFDTPSFLDLGSLCDELRATSSAAGVAAACDAVQRTLTGPRGLVTAEKHRGKAVAHATGVSIYVPLARMSVDYDRLALARRSQWGVFVRQMAGWPKPSSGVGAGGGGRPQGLRRPRQVARGGEPVRVLAVHGIGGVEQDVGWQRRWEGLFRDGIGRFTQRSVEVEFLKLDDIFDAYPVSAADVAEAVIKLGASGLFYGLKDVLTGARGFAPMGIIRWTAGMVVQWASNETLRDATRTRLLVRLRSGPPVDLLAAHSLGSLVAYDSFGRKAERGLLARTAVLTFGSQIGSPFVRGQFGGRIEPLAAAFWCHAYNPNDPVFTASLDVAGDRFRQVLVSQNQPGLLADHDAMHYLAYPGVIDVGMRAAVAEERAIQGARSRGLTARRAAAARKAPGRRNPNRRALIIGIDDYPDPSTRLEGCVNDAYLMSEVLQEIGIDAQHIRLVLNQRATASAIRERVEWLLDDTRSGDSRVLVYSGHGAQVPGYGGAGEVDHLDECLVPWDFDWTPERAILDDWFSALYGQLPYGANFVTVFDCCHSGGMARAGGARVRGLALPDDIRHRQLKWQSGQWMPRLIRLPNETAVARWSGKLARVGKGGCVRKLGRSVGARWLPDGKTRTTGPLARVRKAFGHKGPYMPLLLEACQEDELAYEYTAGTTPHGAFTYFLADTVRSFRAKNRALTIDRLVKEAATKVSALYKQTPRLEGPRSRYGQRLS